MLNCVWYIFIGFMIIITHSMISYTNRSHDICPGKEVVNKNLPLDGNYRCLLLSFFAFLPSFLPLSSSASSLSPSVSFSSVNFIGCLLCAKEYPQVWEKILMRRMNVLLSFLAHVPEWTLDLSIWLSLKWQAQPIRGGRGWIKRQWGWKRLQRGLPP